MARIGDIALVCKSKNAGPFEITIDAVFKDKKTYEKVKASGILCAELFAKLYSVKLEDVMFTAYDAGYAFKATVPRLVPAGDIGDTDVYGAQQHAPLLAVEVPV